MARKSRTKVDHAGAKNGGGFFGTRADAKRVARRLRRAADRIAATAEELGTVANALDLIGDGCEIVQQARAR